MLSKQEEQAERRATLDNDRRVREQTGTYLSHTHDDIHQGRFAAIGTATVVGSTLTPSYPAGPAWCADPGSQCLEPPLSFDNPALEPSMPLEAQAGGAEAPTTDASPGPLSVEHTAPSRFRRRV